jgi:hypothetical protein
MKHIIAFFFIFLSFHNHAMEQNNTPQTAKTKSSACRPKRESQILRDIECRQIDYKQKTGKEFESYFLPIKNALDLQRQQKAMRLLKELLEQLQR